MAADLPVGFTIDRPPIPKTPGTPPGLPSGFTLDAPAAPPPQAQAPRSAPPLAGGPLMVPLNLASGAFEQMMDRGAYAGGGAVTDIATNAGASPEVAAGAGVAGNMAVRAIPTIAGGIAGKMLQPATRAAPILGSRALMQSALKPSSKDLVSGDAAKAIDTMLDGGFSATPGGVAEMRKHVHKLSAQVDALIKGSNAVVDKTAVRQEIIKELSKFRKQVNPNADVKAILNSWNEFKQTVGAHIPVEQAQELKKGTYRILADKYSHLGTVGDEAGTQAQMAIARGLRKGIEKGVPGVVPPNQRQAELINAIEIAERRAGIAGNRDIGGIAWLAENPAAAAGMLADRSPWFKSMLARYMHSGTPATGAAAGTAYGVRNEQQEDDKRKNLIRALKENR